MNEVKSAKVPAEFSLRAPALADLAPIVRLFVDAFPAHPMCALPPRLQLKFIAAHVEEGTTLVAVARGSDRVVGFAIGGRDEQLERARRAFIYGNVIPLAMHRLSRRDSGLRVTTRAARRRRVAPGAQHELRYIAVAEDQRGCGVGSALLRGMEAGLLLEHPYFVWVLADKADTVRFYLQHGFREESRSGSQMRMLKDRR